MAEEDTKMETEEVVQETPAAAEEAMDIMTALKKVLKNALVNDGLKRGLHEACKALDRGTGRLCCLAENCNEPEYTKLVRALCKSRQTPLLMVQSNMELGEWCGLCKIDETGKAKKVVKCSCAVITDFGEESTALEVVMKYIKEQN